MTSETITNASASPGPHPGSRRPVILYLLSGGLSIFGNGLAAIVLPVIVLTTTGQIGTAALVAVVTALPSLLAALGGGVLADRFGRKRLSIVADLGSAVSIAALPLIELTVGLSLGWFVAAGLLGAIFDVPGMTAREALLPAVARAGGVRVSRLAGLTEGLSGVGLLIGPALGGLLLALVSPTVALWVTATTSALAALVTALLPRGIDRVAESGPPSGQPATGSSATTTGPKPSYGPRQAVTELREGQRILAHEPVVLWLCGLTVGAIMVIAPLIGLLLPAWFTSLGQPALMGPVISALAVGGLIGAGAFSWFGHRLSSRLVIIVGLILLSVGLVGVMSFPPYPIMITAALAAGLGSGFFSPVFTTELTARIPERAYGRVLSLQNAGTLAAAPIGMGLVGIVAQGLGLAAAGWTLAGLWVIITAGSLPSPWLRAINRTPNEGES